MHGPILPSNASCWNRDTALGNRSQPQSHGVMLPCCTSGPWKLEQEPSSRGQAQRQASRKSQGSRQAVDSQNHFSLFFSVGFWVVLLRLTPPQLAVCAVLILAKTGVEVGRFGIPQTLQKAAPSSPGSARDH